jgi:hypothetical protein
VHVSMPVYDLVYLFVAFVATDEKLAQ